MRGKILLIDDDKAPMRYYVQELKVAGYEVYQIRNPDEAIRFLEKNGHDLHGVILDSALPPGRVYLKKATEEGSLTGSFLYKHIRENYGDLPMLILTNFSTLEWIRALPKTARQQVARKIDTTPSGLVETMGKLTKANRKQ